MVTLRAMFEDLDKNDFFFRFFFSVLFHFALDEACFGVDLDCCTCAMDMADGALKMFDNKLLSRGMGAVVEAWFVANGSGFVSRLRTEFPIFFDFFSALTLSYCIHAPHPPKVFLKDFLKAGWVGWISYINWGCRNPGNMCLRKKKAW
jgi:hypothetical protein